MGCTALSVLRNFPCAQRVVSKVGRPGSDDFRPMERTNKAGVVDHYQNTQKNCRYEFVKRKIINSTGSWLKINIRSRAWSSWQDWINEPLESGKWPNESGLLNGSTRCERVFWGPETDEIQNPAARAGKVRRWRFSQIRQIYWNKLQTVAKMYH